MPDHKHCKSIQTSNVLVNQGEYQLLSLSRATAESCACAGSSRDEKLAKIDKGARNYLIHASSNMT